MSRTSKSLTSLFTAALASVSLLALAPGAVAAAPAPVEQAVTASRSFRKMSSVQLNLLQESTSSDVDAESNWGGVESLDVPQTQSQAQKDEEARKAAADEAAKQAAQNAAGSANAGRSRSSSQPGSAPVPNFTVTPPNGKTASSVLSFAGQFVGKSPYVSGGTSPQGWDCSGFVQYVFAQFGIGLPRTSGEQAKVGRPVADLSQAMPGDIIANGQHVAIYVGNGMVVNAMNERAGTTYALVSQAMSGSYSIRRVL